MDKKEDEYKLFTRLNKSAEDRLAEVLHRKRHERPKFNRQAFGERAVLRYLEELEAELGITPPAATKDTVEPHVEAAPQPSPEPQIDEALHEPTAAKEQAETERFLQEMDAGQIEEDDEPEEDTGSTPDTPEGLMQAGLMRATAERPLASWDGTRMQLKPGQGKGSKRKQVREEAEVYSAV